MLHYKLLDFQWTIKSSPKTIPTLTNAHTRTHTHTHTHIRSHTSRLVSRSMASNEVSWLLARFRRRRLGASALATSDVNARCSELLKAMISTRRVRQGLEAGIDSSVKLLLLRSNWPRRSRADTRSLGTSVSWKPDRSVRDSYRMADRCNDVKTYNSRLFEADPGIVGWIQTSYIDSDFDCATAMSPILWSLSLKLYMNEFRFHGIYVNLRHGTVIRLVTCYVCMGLGMLSRFKRFSVKHIDYVETLIRWTFLTQ